MKIGNKVVCIYNCNPPYPFDYTIPIDIPVKDEIYEIFNIIYLDNDMGLILKGMNSSPYPAYSHVLFRKVDENFAENLLSKILEKCKQEELIMV